ncbi:MAG: hypothetical protein H0W86_11785 [Armatimonadetes bacterium]|nr:hypothetical protein [Armatimonadota bacterium]
MFAGAVLLPDGSSEITVDVHLATKPGQRGTGYVKFFGDDIERIPGDRELNLYADVGEDKKVSKTWKLKPRTYEAKDSHVTLYIGLGDGPMFAFKYRIVR